MSGKLIPNEQRTRSEDDYASAPEEIIIPPAQESEDGVTTSPSPGPDGHSNLSTISIHNQIISNPPLVKTGVRRGRVSCPEGEKTRY